MCDMFNVVEWYNNKIMITKSIILYFGDKIYQL